MNCGLGASTNRIFLNLFFNAVKAESLPDYFVGLQAFAIIIFCLVNHLAHCEPVANAINAFEVILPLVLAIRSAVS